MAYGVDTGQFVPENLGFSLSRNDEGEITYEIPLSAPSLTREEFGPYNTDWYLYRRGNSGQYKLLNAGMITSVNLSKDRDTVLVAGKDWMHYLKRRTYPFDPQAYKDGGWIGWPKQWPAVPGNPVEVTGIVDDLLDAIENASLPAIPNVSATPGPYGALGIVHNNLAMGILTTHYILPGDTATIFDYISEFSSLHNGFDFAFTPYREFRMWAPVLDGSGNFIRPGRDTGTPQYSFGLDRTNETSGAIVSIDWTNDGPEGTYLLGLGKAAKRDSAVWYYKPSIDAYRRLDKVYDFGEMANTDRLLNMLKNQNDLYPQRKLSLTLLNPEFLSPSLYTEGRPFTLIGNRVNVQFDFSPYWYVNSMYLVNKISWTVDQDQNEEVELELEIIYE